MTKTIIAKEKLDCEHLLGTFVDQNSYDVLIEDDTDCYYIPVMSSMIDKLSTDSNSSGLEERAVAFKFRKNYFSKEIRDMAYEGLKEAATETQNRGLAAGPKGESLKGSTGVARDWVTPLQVEILEFLMDDNAKIFDDNSVDKIKEKWKTKSQEDSRGQVWLKIAVQKVYPEYHGWFDNWLESIKNKSTKEKKQEAEMVATNWISSTSYATAVYSGISGWFDRYPRIPYGRATSYTEQNPEKFAKAYPFLQSLNKGFKDLMPWRWSNQKSVADKLDPKFLVPETVFTTITVNKTFQTACHRDAGDYNDGLSNLLVLSDGEYTGGYLVFPEYRIAVNVRPGDLLLVNNHEIMHGNTPIVLNNPDAERISIVCYFREKMLELKSWGYETLRKQFVDDRRLNKDHLLQRPLWNGVSAGMWESEEWADYLTAHNMIDEDGLVIKKNTIESFFS